MNMSFAICFSDGIHTEDIDELFLKIINQFGSKILFSFDLKAFFDKRNERYKYKQCENKAVKEHTC